MPRLTSRRCMRLDRSPPTTESSVGEFNAEQAGPTISCLGSVGCVYAGLPVRLRRRDPRARPTSKKNRRAQGRLRQERKSFLRMRRVDFGQPSCRGQSPASMGPDRPLSGRHRHRSQDRFRPVLTPPLRSLWWARPVTRDGILGSRHSASSAQLVKHRLLSWTRFSVSSCNQPGGLNEIGQIP